MFITVTYDIADDKRRRAVAKLMEAFGRRVQWSVFDCDLNEARLAELRRRLAMVMDLELDSVRFYRLCVRCRTAISVLGVGTVRDQDDVVIV